MPNKCAVAGCKTGYLTASTKPMFKFPSDSSLREKWIQFLQRQDYSPSSNSSICIDHFEEKYLIRHPNRVRLNTSLYPIPTIHPSSTPQSQAVIPKPCRKPPTERIFQPDELPLFSDMFSVGSLNDVVTYLHTAEEYKGFTFVVTEVSITAYLLYINSGIATIKECIHIDSDLHVQLSYEGVPLPLPAYICKQSGKLHSLDLLTNLPSYCRNATCSYDVGVIKKLVNVSYYSPKGGPKYSSDVLKFALMLRYTSHSAYQFLSNFLPLPSEPLLRKLKSRSVITSDAPKVGYKVLHPGNNKQSVPLALAIFEETTFTAIRSYLPEEHTTADFLQLIHFWWLIVNSKERFHPNPIGNALKMNDSRCDLLSRISLWLENWRDDKTLGLSRQTFDALIKTNRAIADLSNALLSEGYEYVLTGRFQTDPLERRFSQYRQMSGGRFLVSLNEVMRSESIIKIKCMLERDFELSALEDLSHDYVEEPVDVFIEETKNEDLSNLTLSSDSEEVVVYIAGYISHCLLKRTQCECCIHLLNTDPVSNAYVDNLDRGLKLPPSALNNHVQTAFAVLEYTEQKIISFQTPWKNVALRLLNSLSIWENFTCELHEENNEKLAHKIIANIYFKNLAKEINEKMRKDQVEAFKSRQRKIPN